MRNPMRIARARRHTKNTARKRIIAITNTLAQSSSCIRTPLPARATSRPGHSRANHVQNKTYLAIRLNVHVRAVIHERHDLVERALRRGFVQRREAGKGVVIVHAHW